MLFINSCKKLFIAARLAILNSIEYRINFITDAFVQAGLLALIEVSLWIGIFSAAQVNEIAGFGLDYYISYSLWGAFLARISANWMYEHMMIHDIESGKINGILVRPISFYSYYLGQFMGYKIFICLMSFIIPTVVYLFYPGTIHFARIPLALMLCFYYLILVHTLSFIIACFGFYVTKPYSLSFAKNISLWLLTGELFPVDIVPEPFKSILLNLPFVNAVYIPIGYITGRVDIKMVMHGFMTTTLGILVLGVIAAVFWRKALKTYTGTGA